MTFRQSKFGRRDGHEAACKCDHPRMGHYTRDGHCVWSGCGCQEYRAKGRPEYATAKRTRCEYGHSHDSGLETKECFDLHLQKMSGAIKGFEFHPVVDLLGPSGKTIATFEVDFRVDHNDGGTEWVECKGRHLKMDMGFRLKWALLRDLHDGDPKHTFRLRIG